MIPAALFRVTVRMETIARYPRAELSAALRKLADDVERGRISEERQPLTDSSGKEIGEARYIKIAL